jgi:hypothetical protein
VDDGGQIDLLGGEGQRRVEAQQQGASRAGVDAERVVALLEHAVGRRLVAVAEAVEDLDRLERRAQGDEGLVGLKDDVVAFVVRLLAGHLGAFGYQDVVDVIAGQGEG